VDDQRRRGQHGVVGGRHDAVSGGRHAAVGAEGLRSSHGAAGWCRGALRWRTAVVVAAPRWDARNRRAVGACRTAGWGGVAAPCRSIRCLSEGRG
jgi:hypothetical protein